MQVVAVATGCQCADVWQRGVLQVFPRTLPQPADDYVHMRMQLMVEALAQALEGAGKRRRKRRYLL